MCGWTCYGAIPCQLLMSPVYASALGEQVEAPGWLKLLLHCKNHLENPSV
ncbi:hypothetical protein COCMIDRAFT_93633 [Bipolaris oryzae ATCC 44560]|uniref:Uncharacterized protein n=1 Tax=Bipolaris oryzae ATCC 44560 TaxID=930090 RepID=W6Z818_COCMI|nr:uncharacterized protein COCMIDRAFT_93633 [Bipolaris oryzae ATCC 44560]EUC46150.1 hypothetical protein COCMIDRAFT_93633 [Bipolaris oryzae ATCC 44560]